MLTPVILRSALALAVSLIAIVAYNVHAEKKRIGAPPSGAGFALVIVLMINRLSAFALAGTVFAQFMVSKGWANILRSKGLWYPTLLLIGNVRSMELCDSHAVVGELYAENVGHA